MTAAIDAFSFTKEDPDLMEGQSLRDPLGTQIVWSALGRKVIPHLTEQTNSILGFQLLISSFYFYEKFADYIQGHFEQIRGKLAGRTSKQALSLENVFILLEQAFAFSYYATKEDWPLNGKRQVVAFHDDPQLSLKRQILSSQLGTGVWGYYKGAAARSVLLDLTERRLAEEVRVDMEGDGLHRSLTTRKTFRLIEDALLADGVEFPRRPGDRIVQSFSGILEALPQKRRMRECLLAPQGRESVKELASFAVESRLVKDDLPGWRRFIKKCQRRFPGDEQHFANMVRCDDYLGSLDWIFEWLLAFNGEPLRSIARQMPVDVQALHHARREFSAIDTFPKGTAKKRTAIFANEITSPSNQSFLTDLIEVHGKIADSRGATRWISRSDRDKIIVSTGAIRKPQSEPTIRPGFGWRYDYYLTPLMNIFRGLR